MGYEGVAPDFQPKPIGSGNRSNPGLRINADKAHGDWPKHLDVVMPLKKFGMAHKIRVNEDGRVISDEIT